MCGPRRADQHCLKVSIPVRSHEVPDLQLITQEHVFKLLCKHDLWSLTDPLFPVVHGHGASLGGTANSVDITSREFISSAKLLKLLQVNCSTSSGGALGVRITRGVLSCFKLLLGLKKS